MPFYGEALNYYEPGYGVNRGSGISSVARRRHRFHLQLKMEEALPDLK